MSGGRPQSAMIGHSRDRTVAQLLPPEIIHLVVEGLGNHPQALTTASFIGRDWYAPTRDGLFHTITLGRPGLKLRNDPKTRCQELLSLLTTTPGLSACIRTLRIADTGRNLNRNGTPASRANSLLATSSPLPATLDKLKHLVTLILDGTDAAEWSYVTPEAQKAIYSTFAIPSVRHISIVNFNGIPISPFFENDFSHLISLSFTSFKPDPTEDEPRSSISKSGTSARSLQLKVLLLHHNYADILLSFASRWVSTSGGQPPLTQELRINTMGIKRNFIHNSVHPVHAIWEKIPQAFFDSIRVYDVRNERSSVSRAFGTNDLFKICRFRNLVILKVRLLMDDAVTWRVGTDEHIRHPFYELVAELENGQLKHLEEFKLASNIPFKMLAKRGLVGAPWQKLDKALVPRCPHLQSLHIYLTSDVNPLDGSALLYPNIGSAVSQLQISMPLAFEKGILTVCVYTPASFNGT
ncbi:hypothetical protein FA15DRAFT_290134 [Coprinopsis marcescibilis]|uniref:F-box domain-containing protein n=1 Tax=Coprinopsis marcescibilis TaxID=230819 RepID=A0A5C3LAF9_COPMA|nr:hypothetical protein FA15DRAFT_290134 [Coprinopsis marcescibilis]